ncbi:hypothetical protein Tco_1451062, partial [Tanacetum coccineum]
MRNKSDLDTLSMDDLYNNMKITNETVNTAHNVFAASFKDQASTASYADDVMFSFFSNQFKAPQLYNENLEQIDADDLEEIDLKWQVAMLTMRVKRAPRNQGNRNRDDPRRNAPMNTSTINALVVQDVIGLSSSSSSDSEYDIQVKDISIKDLKNQLEEALKEKDDLKLKLEKFEESSKNLTKLINSQISAKDKTGLGYDGQMNESEVIHIVFNSREIDVDDNPVNDRFKTGEGFHAVPPPYTRNYMPSRPDLSFAGLDEYVFKSTVRKTTTSVPETKTSISKTSKDIVEKPKTVRPSAPIIEEWDTDNDNDSVFRPKSDQKKQKFTKINFALMAFTSQGSSNSDSKDGQMNESELNNIHMNESEVVHSVFNSSESDVDDNLVNDRFKTCEGFHAVLPPYTGNYMPPRPDLSFDGLDESVF